MILFLAKFRNQGFKPAVNCDRGGQIRDLFFGVPHFCLMLLGVAVGIQGPKYFTDHGGNVCGTQDVVSVRREYRRVNAVQDRAPDRPLPSVDP
ncbi:MAG TPA: hypothetical protein VF491_21860 [Vicinamibacterales bacterium]